MDSINLVAKPRFRGRIHEFSSVAAAFLILPMVLAVSGFKERIICACLDNTPSELPSELPVRPSIYEGELANSIYT